MIALYLINPITLLIVYIIYTKSSGLFKKLITVIGGLLDIAVNLSWFTVIFADVPKELLLTKRIERLKNSTVKGGWLSWLTAYRSWLAWQYKADIPLCFGYYNSVNIGYKAHKGITKLMYAGRILGIRKSKV